MKTWTETAKDRLEGYLRERGARSGLSGEELQDVTEDWRLHVYEALEREPAAVVSVDVLEPVLVRLGSGKEEQVRGDAIGRGGEWTESSLKKAFVAPKRRILSWIFGVWFPLGIVLFEWGTSFCGSVFFDPIRTWVHGALLLFVPLVNAWILRTTARGEFSRPRLMAGLGGFGVAVAAFYAWMFVPLAPLSVIALAAFGMGLLSLSPIFVFFVSLRVGKYGQEACGNAAGWRSSWWMGVLAGVLVLAALEAGPFVTRLGLNKALSEDREEEAAGIASLRRFHSEDVLHRACYEGNRGTSMSTDISGWLIKGWSIPASFFGVQPIGQTDSMKTREVFYRVTGKPFNSMKPPRWARGDGFLMADRGRSFEDFEWDSDLGGEQVAARVKGLTLEESRMDANLDAAAGLGYCEWTTVFKNVAAVSREARFQVQLPPGGVASRVTLWINGEPREAAFASKGKVRAAYQEVAVQQQRDPVLVTACGPERILVQCFPVLPDGGEMKIRVGVTAPLVKGEMVFPEILERNFSVPKGVEHAVWVQSAATFSLGEDSSVPDGTGQSLQVSRAFEEGVAAVGLREAAILPEVYCEDPFAVDEERYLIMKRGEVDVSALDRCVVVVDGSGGMRAHAEELVRVLDRFADRENFMVLLADDGATEVGAGVLAPNDFSGGRDNVPALVEAVREARKVERGAVVWVHGAQPLRSRTIQLIDQLYERGSKQVPLYSVPLEPGGNRVLEELFKYRAVQSGVPIDDLEGDLTGFLERLVGGTREEKYYWTRQSTAPLDTVEVSDQLARWWAATQVREALRQQTADPERVAFAAKYQLVTAFSGAVVLETAAQYARHGLTPVDATSTPQIPATPEPGVMILLLLGSLSGMWRRKRAC